MKRPSSSYRQTLPPLIFQSPKAHFGIDQTGPRLATDQLDVARPGDPSVGWEDGHLRLGRGADLWAALEGHRIDLEEGPWEVLVAARQGQENDRCSLHFVHLH
jgi:hypothetical protein